MSDSLNKILYEIKPSLVHVQHFLNWHIGVLEDLVSYGVPVVMSFHDYYALTPVFTLEGAEDPPKCFSPEYSKKIFGKDLSPYLSARRSSILKSLSSFSKLIAPSSSLVQDLRSVYPFRYEVIEHGIKPFPLGHTASQTKKLRFGYLGGLVRQKGIADLLQGFELARTKNANIELHVHGGKLDPEPDGVISYGHYNQDDLTAVLNTFDVGVIPSIFRETFCLALSEMWRAEKPVMASNIGSLKQRIEHQKNGYLFQFGNVLEISNGILWFAGNDDWKNWKMPPVKLATEMVKEYESIYASYTR